MDQLRADYNIGLVYADQNDLHRLQRHPSARAKSGTFAKSNTKGTWIQKAIEAVRQRQLSWGFDGDAVLRS